MDNRIASSASSFRMPLRLLSVKVRAWVAFIAAYSMIVILVLSSGHFAL
jgi:hypothetical protein